MMAAARILIWLPVRLVRRSSISNMAFSPWRMFVFERTPRLRPAGAGEATLSTRRTEAHRDAGHLRIHARRRALANRPSKLGPQIYARSRLGVAFGQK